MRTLRNALKLVLAIVAACAVGFFMFDQPAMAQQQQVYVQFDNVAVYNFQDPDQVTAAAIGNCPTGTVRPAVMSKKKIKIRWLDASNCQGTVVNGWFESDVFGRIPFSQTLTNSSDGDIIHFDASSFNMVEGKTMVNFHIEADGHPMGPDQSLLYVGGGPVLLSCTFVGSCAVQLEHWIDPILRVQMTDPFTKGGWKTVHEKEHPEAHGIIGPIELGTNQKVVGFRAWALDTKSGKVRGYLEASIENPCYIPLSLGNLVWNDANNNGQVDNGESGIDGVLLELYKEGQQPGVNQPMTTTTSNGGGFYGFNNLMPGKYFVRIPSPPAQYPLSSTDTDINDNQEDSDDNGTQITPGQSVTSPIIDLQLGQEPTNDGNDANGDLTVDFGFYMLVNLGNLVWNDANNNGQVDNGESGIDGVLLELYKEGQQPGVNQPMTTTTSNGGGFYGFNNLMPGKYFVRIPSPPAQYPLSSTDTDINDNQEDSDDNGTQITPGQSVTSPIIDLQLGQEPTNDGNDANGDLTVDFGFYLPVQKLEVAVHEEIFVRNSGEYTSTNIVVSTNKGYLVNIGNLAPGQVYHQVFVFQSASAAGVGLLDKPVNAEIVAWPFSFNQGTQINVSSTAICTFLPVIKK